MESQSESDSAEEEDSDEPDASDEEIDSDADEDKASKKTGKEQYKVVPLGYSLTSSNISDYSNNFIVIFLKHV